MIDKCVICDFHPGDACSGCGFVVCMYCAMLYMHDRRDGHYLRDVAPLCGACGGDDGVSSCHGCGDFFCFACSLEKGHNRGKCVHRPEILDAVRALAVSVLHNADSSFNSRERASMVIRWVALREGFKEIDEDSVDGVLRV